MHTGPLLLEFKNYHQWSFESCWLARPPYLVSIVQSILIWPICTIFIFCPFKESVFHRVNGNGLHYYTVTYTLNCKNANKRIFLVNPFNIDSTNISSNVKATGVSQLNVTNLNLALPLNTKCWKTIKPKIGAMLWLMNHYPLVYILYFTEIPMNHLLCTTKSKSHDLLLS